MILALTAFSAALVSCNANQTPVLGQALIASAADDGPSANVSDVLPGTGGEPWIAVGSSQGRAGRGIAAAVWTSPDGVAWEGGTLSEGRPIGRGETRLNSVTRQNGTIIAAGVDSREGRRVPTVWLSTDTRRWHRNVVDEAAEGEVEQVLDGAGGLIAFGSNSAGETPGPAVWTSADGGTWSRGSLPLPAQKLVSRWVASTGPQGGLLLGSTENNERFVWTSADGRAWLRQENVIGLPSVARTEFVSVLWGKDRWVGIGRDGEAMAVWTSLDGHSWAAGSLAPNATGRLLTGSVLRDRLVVLGINHDDQMSLYESADGATWTTSPKVVPEDLQRRLLPGTLAPLREFSGRLVITATHRGGPGIWIEQNGDWQRVLDSPDAVPDPSNEWNLTVSDVASSQRGYIAVGSKTRVSDIAEKRTDGVVWTSKDAATWQLLSGSQDTFQGSPLSAVAFRNGQYVALGERSIWLSTDGREWQRSTIEGLDDQTLEQLESIASGFVAAGRKSVEGENRSNLVAWASPDGRTWAPAIGEGATALISAGDMSVSDLCSTGDGVMMVGDEARDDARTATTWKSSDGLHWQRGPEVPDARRAQLGDCLQAGRDVLVGGALRSDMGSSAHVWRSSGGGQLGAPTPITPPRYGNSRVSYLESIPGGGFAAVGAQSFLSADEVVVWISEKGDNWRPLGRQQDRVPPLNGESPDGASVDKHRVVVPGRIHAAQTHSPAVWVGPSAGRLREDAP